MSGSTPKDGLARNAALPIKASANVSFRSMFLMNSPFIRSSGERALSASSRQCMPFIFDN